jgi:hypothetical protein
MIQRTLGTTIHHRSMHHQNQQSHYHRTQDREVA